MSKRILIVEDDTAVLDGFSLILRKAGYEVSVSTDGNQLLNPTFDLPDLIILDKQLSGVDGLDICRHLKNKAETSHIFIVMTSATPHVARLAAAALADAFIEKPFNNVYLVENVKKLLS